MHLFTFEPGDGYSYRVLFGRLPASTPLIPFYAVFGIAEGSSEAGAWFAFDTDQIGEGTFQAHMYGQPGITDVRVYWTAWRLWLALTGHDDDDEYAAGQLPAWKADWRKQLPTAALG